MNSRADMDRVYSGIVYQKGAAILRMLEEWVGPDTFRKGIQDYLRSHALGTATSDDLAGALGKTAGLDVAPVLISFLDQPGFPAVRAEPGCGFASANAGRWTIPVCVHGDDGASTCTVLSAARREFHMGSCPAWVWPNRGGAGYFRVEPDAALLEATVTNGWDQLTSAEKLSLIEDLAGPAEERSRHRPEAAAADGPRLPTRGRQCRVPAGPITVSSVDSGRENPARYRTQVYGERIPPPVSGRTGRATVFGRCR